MPLLAERASTQVVPSVKVEGDDLLQEVEFKDPVQCTACYSSRDRSATGDEARPGEVYRELERISSKLEMPSCPQDVPR